MNPNDAIIRIQNVTKWFGSIKAVDNVSLNVPRGSFTTLLGPSGCGKTTLMRLIAGFYEADGGDIYIDCKRVNGVPPYKRNTPLVFQEYALFPHMTIFENISYGLKLKGLSKTEIKEKVDEMLQMFSLQGMENRFPRQLSGGQQQRVALARALVMGQSILLLDEPLSNLDAKLRVEVRGELRELQQRLGITTVYVTHDQDEALSMSDVIAVMDNGIIRQIGSPWEIYFKPRNKFVANFVGTVNFIQAKIKEIAGSNIIASYAGGEISIRREGYSVSPGQRVILAVRPECISISENNDGVSGANQLFGEIKKSSFLGHMIRYWVKCREQEFIVDDFNPSRHGCMSGKVNISFDGNKVHILEGEG
ncbi:ABC transporter ATP-binding protein [Moorella sulfitireducens]|uniref:ABC transporter ATP-binding protein n=1 Tax=Neomoorella sulfitireducens TaxID=2972948 RepID=UPI0021AC9F63|nr:ABC transporter ATP-binding protein [Moorella sulfitireducens]